MSQFYAPMSLILERAQDIATCILRDEPPNTISLYGVPRGGIPAVFAVMAEIGHRRHVQIVEDPNHADYIIDDIIDSGATAKRYVKQYACGRFLSLFDKRHTDLQNKWLVMPWEQGEDPTRNVSGDDIIVRLLQFIGEDPEREGLRETPARVLGAWKEWARGYGQDPVAILKSFADGAGDYNEMVIVHNIPVVSKCEHHLADMVGIAHVGYIPNGRIVGLSKLPRLVDAFARRLQVQERLTVQIVDALANVLNPVGAGVLIRCSHSCMSTRGVQIHGSTTTTTALRGALLDKPEARAEFLRLCQAAEEK